MPCPRRLAEPGALTQASQGCCQPHLSGSALPSMVAWGLNLMGHISTHLSTQSPAHPSTIHPPTHLLIHSSIQGPTIHHPSTYPSIIHPTTTHPTAIHHPTPTHPSINPLSIHHPSIHPSTIHPVIHLLSNNPSILSSTHPPIHYPSICLPSS